MATIEQVREAAKLRRQGLPVDQAVSQVRVNNLPVQPTGGATIPIAPQVTPTAPTPAPTQETVTGVNGEQFAKAPVNTETGLSAPQAPTPQPVTPAPQPTPTPTPTPVSTTPDQAQIEREKISAQNKATLEQNQQKAELERQNKAIEAKSQIPTDEKSIVQAFMSGVSIPPQKTQAYRSAQYQYGQFQKYNAMTPSQLTTALSSGEIGSEMAGLLAQNPNFAQAKADFDKKNKVRNINDTISNIYKGMNEEVPAQRDYLQELSDKLTTSMGLDDVTQAEAFAQYVTGDQKIVDYTNQLSSINRQVADVSKLISDGIKDLKAKKGDLPASALVTLLNSTFREANTTLENLNNTKSYLEADLKMATEMAKANYDAVSRDVENARSRDNAVFSQLIQGQFNLATKQAEAEMANQMAREAQNDPYKAIPAMIEEYKKLNIPFTRSTQQIIQDFEGSGQDLATYLTDLQKQIQGKPEYEAYKARQSGTEWQSTSITRYNPSTGANESTPIFYRKKTSGGFEAVDLSGNPIDVSSLTGGGTTGGGTTTPGTLPSSFTGDTTSYIASKEGFRDKAYQDSAGVWTIGYGTTKINGKPVQPGQTITQAEAQKQLEADIAKHSNWKNYIDENTLSPSQRTALASFEYNLGPGIWDKGAVNIISMIKSGDLQGASKEMQKYVNAGGKRIQGLANRRAEEAQLLLNTGKSEGQTYSPDKIKSFETFDGKTFPSDYKTPAQQKQYRDEYNTWRASQGSNQIKTGQDIINIRMSDKATEGEKNALQYSSRALNAINDLPQYEDVFAKLPLKDQLFQQYAPDLLKSDNQKILESRKKDFITAILRKESGASIAPSEFANEEKKYFAQPGDSQAVIVAKQNARNFAIKSLLTGAGQDVNGRAINTLYNPPIIEAKTSGEESIADRLKRLRNK